MNGRKSDNSKIEIWGGIECTINRVDDKYFDQLEYSGHYNRQSDLDLVAGLGIKMLRYPVLWEKNEKREGGEIDWSFADKSLSRLKELQISPIAGLVHHGSGPRWVNFYDGSFENGLARYAKMVAERFPGLEYFTPVNEPLTTARFCGLYGHWYPHKKTDYDFFKVLLSECKATVMAMKAIREVNPEAKLIQTEDLGKCHSTPLLQYQAHLENERRWVSYELLSGKLGPEKYMWQYMLDAGIPEKDLQYFLDNNCCPDVCGFNYYLTSERYLDEDLKKYPKEFHGSNGKHEYADIHTVLVDMGEETGAYHLLKEAWERLQLPLAITECHLHSPREEQLRWFNEMWHTLHKLKSEETDIRAITAWALFGLHGWNCLCTKPYGDYEPGAFNLNSGTPRPTALAYYLRELAENRKCDHPILDAQGWWKRSDRMLYSKNPVVNIMQAKVSSTSKPLLIIGKTGTLGKAFAKICEERHVHHIDLGRSELDITNRKMAEEVIGRLKPWAVINTAGYVKVDEAEEERKDCYKANFKGPVILADICARFGARLLSFSSDLVFSGTKGAAYTESDLTKPLNVYGMSKAKSESKILETNPESLIIRTSSFFGPWDEYNFAVTTLKSLKEHKKVFAANDIHISPTYVPDLVHECLNLLLDRESGIVHLTNTGVVTWYQFAKLLAEKAGMDTSLIQPISAMRMHFKAMRPSFSALTSEKGIFLPTFENAIDRFFEAQGTHYVRSRIAG